MVDTLPFPVAVRLLAFLPRTDDDLVAGEVEALLDASPQLTQTVAVGLALETIQQWRSQGVRFTSGGRCAWLADAELDGVSRAVLHILIKRNFVPEQLVADHGLPLRSLVLDAMASSSSADEVRVVGGEAALQHRWIAALLRHCCGLTADDPEEKCCTIVTVADEGRVSRLRFVRNSIVSEGAEAAVSANHEACLRFLFEWSPSPPPFDLRTLVHGAAEAGSEGCLRALREWGADLESELFFQPGAVYKISALGHVGCLGYLRESGISMCRPSMASFDTFGWYTVHFAASQGRHECLRLLHDWGVDAGARDSAGRTPSHIAARAGHEKCLRLLRHWGADCTNETDAYTCTPAYYAAEGGHDACLKLLLGWENGLQHYSARASPADAAASNGHVHCLRLLRDSGFDITSTNSHHRRTPLHAALEKDQDVCLRYFIEEVGVRPASLVTPEGETLLHCAARAGALRCLRMLCEAGEDIHATTEQGDQATHLASASGATECLRLLLDQGADVAATNRKGLTLACYAANEGCLELLHTRGIDLRRRCNNGWTAAHYAVQNGLLDNLRYLKSLGILRWVESTADQPSLGDVARMYSQGRCYQFLASCAHEDPKEGEATAEAL